MRRLALALVPALVLVFLHPRAGANSPTDFVQPLWFERQNPVLDVLIVPPGRGQIFNEGGALGGQGLGELTPYENTYLRAVERSIADWDRAILAFGADWLRHRLITNVYVLGRDTVGESVLKEPEIVIASDEWKATTLGLAVAASAQPCLVNNSKFFTASFTYADMYNVNGHEFGHCLGLGHSDGPPSDPTIATDMMYARYSALPGQLATPLHCTSNLNVRGLELVFGEAFGQIVGNTLYLPWYEYSRIDC